MTFTKVTTDGIADSAVSTAKIGANAVDTTKIGADVIVADDIADNAITVAQISDGAVTTAKIPDGAVTTAKIPDGAVTHSKFHTTALNPITLDQTNNRVGIGTASPSYTLHSTTSSGSNYAGFFHNSSGSGNSTALVTKGGANNTGAGTFIVQDYNGNTDLMVDGVGHVTMPNQPYFYVRGTTNGTNSSTAVIPFNSSVYNVGNHYNTSNYTFTAPVTGKYLFTCSVLNYPSTAASGEIYFSLNGGSYNPLSRHNNIPGQVSLVLSAIKYLNANDTIKVMGTLYYYVTGGHGHFSGILLG